MKGDGEVRTWRGGKGTEKKETGDRQGRRKKKVIRRKGCKEKGSRERKGEA